MAGANNGHSPGGKEHCTKKNTHTQRNKQHKTRITHIRTAGWKQWENLDSLRTNPSACVRAPGHSGSPCASVSFFAHFKSEKRNKKKAPKCSAIVTASFNFSSFAFVSAPLATRASKQGESDGQLPHTNVRRRKRLQIKRHGNTGYHHKHTDTHKNERIKSSNPFPDRASSRASFYAANRCTVRTCTENSKRAASRKVNRSKWSENREQRCHFAHSAHREGDKTRAQQ